MTSTPPLTKAELAHFTGDLERYRHSFNRRMLYTPGVQYLAERAGAYWLIDEIAILLGTGRMRGKIERDPRLGELQFWRLRVRRDDSAELLLFADADEPPSYRKQIAFTDFPLDSIDLWAGFDGTHWTIYLPSEH
jgi:hypothetical protein